MNNLESAYNRALEMLKKGHSKEAVLLEFPEVKTELAPLLELSSALLSLPKLEAPTPAMQRKYAFAPSKSFWLNWIHISKFAGVSMSVMLLVSAFAVTGYASYKSAPGQTLFAVKKSAEQLQLVLAYSQNQKASIQVQIAQSRLNDAQEIFSNPASNAAQEQAALNELSSQTSNAVAVVNTVAKSDPKSDNNTPLLSSLESITKQQQNLLTDIKPSSDIKVATNNAIQSLQQTSAKITQIKQYVAVATDDQTLATLSSDPNSVAVLGEINQISQDKITVEKTSFVITTKTVIKNAEGNSLEAKNLTLNTKVNIVGTKNKDGIIAQQILVSPSANTDPTVKGESTSTIENADDQSQTSTPTSIKKDDSSKDLGTSTSPTIKIDPNATQGSFILEDPAPQFSPN